MIVNVSTVLETWLSAAHRVSVTCCSGLGRCSKRKHPCCFCCCYCCLLLLLPLLLFLSFLLVLLFLCVRVCWLCVHLSTLYQALQVSASWPPTCLERYDGCFTFIDCVSPWV
jgi:hypothetical protein